MPSSVEIHQAAVFEPQHWTHVFLSSPLVWSLSEYSLSDPVHVSGTLHSPVTQPPSPGLNAALVYVPLFQNSILVGTLGHVIVEDNKSKVLYEKIKTMLILIFRLHQRSTELGKTRNTWNYPVSLSSLFFSGV